MAVTDEAGKVTASYDYTPYGQFIRKEADSGLTIPFLYNGQFGVTTDESGLYYMRARYYNVDIKRFMNQDVLTGTLERISSLNRYAYAEGNPVSYLDPFGLAIEMLQNAVSIASVLVSCLRLFEFIAPQVIPVIDNILTFTTIVLDIIQCVRYDFDEEKLNKLKKDCIISFYDKIIPVADKALVA